MLPGHPRISCGDSINESHFRRVCYTSLAMVLTMPILLSYFLDTEIVQQPIELALEAALLSIQVWPSPPKFFSYPVPTHAEIYSMVPTEEGFFLSVPKTWWSRPSNILITRGMDWSGNSLPVRRVFPHVEKWSRLQVSFLDCGRPIRQYNLGRLLLLGVWRRLLLTRPAQALVVIVQDRFERHLVLTCAFHGGVVA